MIVVYGGLSSGKSNVAENIAVDIYKNSCELKGDNKKLYYLATMETSSDAAAKRIARHRKLREGKGFETVEEQLELSRVYEKVTGGIVLLECVSNLVANVLFDRYKEEAIPSNEINVVAKEISDKIIKLGEISELVVVTNNVFGDYYSQDAWCDAYMRVLGRVNGELAAKADQFLEVTAGRINVISSRVSKIL